MRYLFLFLIVVLFAGTRNADAQTQRYKFTQINLLEDASIGQVNSITEDKYGFIWFSEEANSALTRFDGNDVKRYSNIPGDSNSLGGTLPECLFIDRAGYIWIGFFGTGLDRFDPLTETFTHFRHDPNDQHSLANDFVSSIVEDSQGNLYVATFGGMDIFDRETGVFTHFRHDPADSTSLSSDFVRKLYIDKKGAVWVGTGWFVTDVPDEGGLNLFDKKSKTFTRYMADPGDPTALTDRRITAMLEDSKGNFWVGTGGDGLHSMDRSSGKFTRHTRDLNDPNKLSAPVLFYNGFAYGVTFLAEDLRGKLWIGAQGINVYDPDLKTMAHFGSSRDFYGTFIENSAWCIHIGNNGLIWISTQPGVYKVDPYNFTIPRVDDVIPSYLRESDSISWTGLYHGLVRENHNDGSETRFIHDPGNPNSISNDTINTIYQDEKGAIWVGTNRGLNKLEFEARRITTYIHNPDDSLSISDNVILTIANDRNGAIWVGTNNGLNRWDKTLERFKLVNITSHMPSKINSIYDIEQGRGDDLWITEYQSVFLDKINTKTGELESFNLGYEISDVLKDALGRIWVTSPRGLFRYNEDDRKFEIIATHPMFAMFEDINNTLWISSTSYLFRKELMSENLVQYTGDYVVRAGSLNPQRVGGYIDHRGKITLGDNKDYYVFNPERFQMPPDSARVYVTNFWVGEDLIQPSKSSLLTGSIMESSEVHLSYDQNTFSFSGTEIDFRSPYRNKINYILEGYDLNWRETFSKEKVTYLNVPPGQYIFRIKASNSSTGLLGENKISVFISPPWWKAWWAYTIYGMLFIGGVIMVDRIQRKRLLGKAREEAREKELEQAREIEKAYQELKVTQSQLIQSEKMASLGELTAGIAHEIQNPLNFVNNFSEINNELIDDLKEAVAKNDQSEIDAIFKNLKENESKVTHHGKRAEEIVRAMLQHSRGSEGQKELTDINKLCDEYLRLAYHGFRAKDKSFNAAHETDFDPSLPQISVVPQDMGRVILNLLNNAFQASSAEASAKADNKHNPKVTVSTKSNNNHVEITVSDNGSGIPDKIKEKIFQPFFTTKPAGQGTGLGLSLSYDIVKAHGGEIKLKTVDGRGSEFIVSLPIA